MVDSITSLDFFPLRCLCRSHSVHSLVPGHVPLMAVVFLSSLVQNGTWNHWSVIVCVCVCVRIRVCACACACSRVSICSLCLYACIFCVFSRANVPSINVVLFVYLTVCLCLRHSCKAILY